MGSVYGIPMGGGTGYITNPFHMGRFTRSSAGIYIKTQLGANGSASSTAGFFSTSLDKCGAYVEITDNSAYTTVCNITGGGFFVWALAPQWWASVGQSAPYLKITIDGTAYEVAHPAGLLFDGDRMGIGSFWVSMTAPGSMLDSNANTHTGVNLGGFVNTTLSDDKGWYYNGSYSVILPHPLDVIQLGLSLCRFSSSLKVEAKNAYLGSSGAHRYAGACYMLDL